MKYLNTILSIIIIALSGMPCVDGQVSMNRSQTTVIVDASSHKSGQHPDACSPFCVCNCCRATPFIGMSPYPAESVFVSAIIKKQLLRYTSALYSNFHASIWQPPKIS